ncbi:hypothetical protein N4P55_26500 [Pseudomonas fluorescens]|jgi:hypothetical protein|uniref:hypothetical protein n=1 Tax=Pseudomonas fluorescens TaxID=294 RepID=UPI0021D07681|nr:hypothetical protein [Pseudomonas fluorescens]UXV19372.1 hypothetical protein N4P55_26500 [Pseudomonas fluorescens]
MGQVNPNGTYKGFVSSGGERNAATLTIIASDPQTGNITNAKMDYYGLAFKVDGTFAYQNLSNESPVAFTLRAQVSGGDNNLHNITLTSADRNYTTLNGKTTVARGGPNVGVTYDINFQKA